MKSATIRLRRARSLAKRAARAGSAAVKLLQSADAALWSAAEAADQPFEALRSRTTKAKNHATELYQAAVYLDEQITGTIRDRAADRKLRRRARARTRRSRRQG